MLCHFSYGEQKENMLFFVHRMATRRDIRPSDSEPAPVMAAAELENLRSNLSRLGIGAVRQAYHTAYARCRMVNDHVPSARAVQEFVQVWKELWARR